MDLSNKHITLNVQYIPEKPNDISINAFLFKGIMVNEIVPFNDSQKIFHLKLQTKIKGKTTESIKYKNITHVYVIMNIFDLDNFQNRQDVFCMLGFFLVLKNLLENLILSVLLTKLLPIQQK